ncbi:MAG: AmmeMemoRadiSam system protein B [Candidatus Omnitrophota bacterium]
MIRQAYVSGQFYPADVAGLKKQLETFIEKKVKKENALGIVAPHAGYMYSGPVAGACYSRIRVTPTVVIIGPNHTGMGEPFSLMSKGTWQMPLGNVEINTELAEAIRRRSKYLQQDSQAHLHEHSIEVQIPFLQYFLPEVRIVPLILAGADFAVYAEIGAAIAGAIKENKPALIVASSDMTHYLPHEKAKSLDALAIERILKLDVQGLLDLVKEKNISMCGYGPVACMLSAVKELKGRGAQLIKYQTSGETGGDYSSVVGYAGIVVK